MGTVIKNFPDGSIIEFDIGIFDSWCVYLTEGESRTPPKDVDYFGDLKTLSNKHGADKIYCDFVTIFDATTKFIDQDLLATITILSKEYDNDDLRIDRLFTIIYAGMIAEENKQHAILKKRIKRLGVHQVLIEDVAPEYAATFSKGKRWRELDAECASRGF